MQGSAGLRTICPGRAHDIPSELRGLPECLVCDCEAELGVLQLFRKR